MMDNSTIYSGNLSTTTAKTIKVEGIVMPIVYSLIVILGLIGNGFVIGAVLRYKSMRSAPNVFIVNLAVGDILMNLVTLPVAGLEDTVHGWIFGLAFCKIGHFIATLSLGLSVFTLTALSIDRVLVISQSLKLWQKASLRITIMVVVVWILAIIVAVPDAISHHLVYFENGDFIICKPYPVDWVKKFQYDKIQSMAQITIFFIIPLIIITVSYGIMAHVMVKSARCIPGESTDGSVWRKRQIKTRRKVANIMIVLIILFFVCWLPRSIIVLYNFYADIPWSLPWHHFKLAARCLMFANGCINPIALYFLSKSFKTYFKKQLCCGRVGNRPSDTELATADETHAMTRLLRSNHKADGVEVTDATTMEHC